MTNGSVKAQSDNTEILDSVQNASVTISGPAPTPTPSSSSVVAINSGGSTSGDFVADTDYTGGQAYSTSTTVDTSGVTNPAPQSVYQTVRFGNFTYTISNLTPSSNYTVRLHFNELYWNSTGSRVFNVSINSTQVLSNYDIYQAAGGSNKATVEQFNATTDSSGDISIVFTNVVDNAMVSGIEVLSASSPTPELLTISSPIVTYNPTLTLSGTKDSSITEILVNGSSVDVSYPTSTTWKLPIWVNTGENTYTIVGKDQNNQEVATLNVTVSRHNFADLNGDGNIDLVDASLFALDWGKTSNFNPLSDLDNNNAIDLLDLSTLAKLLQ